MAEWKSVGPAEMLADGEMKEVKVGDVVLLLARVGGQVYAADGLCKHLGGHLARGKLNGFVVTCPQHKSTYDLRDGHNIEWIPKIPGIARTLATSVKKPTGLRTYPTRVQDGQVWVEI